MEKKNIILELPCELIDKIDRLNTTDDRSSFISNLLEKQIEENERISFKAGMESPTVMSNNENAFDFSGIIDIVNTQGVSLGKFNINTLDGFEELTKKIKELSEDPAVQIRASTLF
jgi:hypothetical protein